RPPWPRRPRRRGRSRAPTAARRPPRPAIPPRAAPLAPGRAPRTLPRVRRALANVGPFPRRGLALKPSFLPLLLLGLLPLASCTKTSSSQQQGPAAAHDDDAHADSQGHEDEHAPLPRRVRLSDKMISEAGIATEPVTRRALASFVELSGEIVADPDRQAFVATRVPGRIERVLFREGDEVKKGQLLAVVRAP